MLVVVLHEQEVPCAINILLKTCVVVDGLLGFEGGDTAQTIEGSEKPRSKLNQHECKREEEERLHHENLGLRDRRGAETGGHWRFQV